MAKGKAKNNSGSLTSPQLRSRKRECPNEEMCKTGDVQDPLSHQEPTMTSAQQHQTAEQSCLSEQDPGTEEKHVKTTNVPLKNVTRNAEAQKETTDGIPNDVSQFSLRVHTHNDTNQNAKEKEEITANEFNSLTYQTCTDQLQVLLAASKEDDGYASPPETKLQTKVVSQYNLERNQETSHKEHRNVNTADVKEVTKEAEAGLPAKKKRRMGMCGLTEKERSLFLQTQKRENWQNGLERAEEQFCNDTAELVAQEEIISLLPLPSSPSIPAAPTEQTETKLKPSHCGWDDRTDTEVLTAVTTSDAREGYQAEGSIVPGPEQIIDKKSDPSAEKELLRNQDQQEPEECEADIKAEKHQEQMKDVGGGSHPVENERSESLDNIEAAHLQVNSVTRTRNEKKEEVTCEGGNGDLAEAGASSTDIHSGRFNCGSVKYSEATLSPGGSERKDNCDPDDTPVAGPSTLITVDPQTEDTSALLESGHLDYVSDTQLNAITLIEEEEEVMEEDEDLGFPNCHDATDLICGLSRELSSLNQKIMAAHRELENLRRHKSSRSSVGVCFKSLPP